MLKNLCLLILASLLLTAGSCRRGGSEYVTVALPESFSTLDTLTSTASDSAAERVRNLMFNSLVKKNENFEYVGDLASEIRASNRERFSTRLTASRSPISCRLTRRIQRL